MRYRGLILTVGVALTASAPEGMPAQARVPERPVHYFKTESFRGVSFQYGSSLTRSIRASYQPASRGIIDFPRSIQFLFDGYIVPATYANVDIYQVAGMTPAERKHLDGLRRALSTHPSLAGKPVPTIFSGGEGTVDFYAKQTYIRFVNGSGIGFIAQGSMGPYSRIGNPFYFEFDGLTDDGRYAVYGYMPIIVTGAPTYTPSRPVNVTAFKPTVKAIARFVNNASDTAMVPYRTNLLRLFRSLSVHPRKL